MRVWNVSDMEIRQLYNNKPVVIPAGKEVDVFDDMGVFLLNKREIRGKGLVQLKDGDNKADRYKQGKRQIYMWAEEMHNNYLKHCEERREINQPPIPPSQTEKDYQKTIKEYEEWENAGFPMKEEFNQKPVENKVYACPQCPQEFLGKEELFQHLKSHEKEENVVHIGSVADKSS